MKEITKERLNELLERILADYQHKISSTDVNRYTEELSEIIQKDKTIFVEITRNLDTGIYDMYTNLDEDKKKDVMFNVVTSVNLKHVLDNNTEITFVYNNDDENTKVPNSKNIKSIRNVDSSHTIIYELMEKYNINVFTIKIKNRLQSQLHDYNLRPCPR